MNNRYCIIMAGGIGTRFWPLSRNIKPKQFLDILGIGKSFLQMTYDRFAKLIPESNMIVVTSQQYRDIVKEQLPQLSDDQILLEPFRKNTAPCIAYATYKLMEKDPKASAVIAPSDHLIINDTEFLHNLEAAFELADREEVLITLGIKPTRPETNFGYIQAYKSKKPVNINGHLAYEVKTFTEKPDLELAKVFVDSGEFYWNSGLFIWNLKTIDKEMDRLMPDIARLFKSGKGIYYTDGEQKFISEVYGVCRSLSIDYGVLEKSEHVRVFAANFDWSDLGTWESYYLLKEKDHKGNVVDAPNNFLEEVRDCVIISEDKNKLLAVKGLKDFLIINTPDVLMICPRKEKAVKQLLTDISLSKLEKVL
ncbi:MAG: mannose-1-phosphate guanylyltransferase [Bacteroidales bacterium]|nr:mannose-1-phosphate guanylyltransferase [Bacteroidales bacterium]